MTDKVFGRGHIAQLNSDPARKKAVTVRKTIAQVESEAFARGYAKAVEDAAQVVLAETEDPLLYPATKQRLVRAVRDLAKEAGHG